MIARLAIAVFISSVAIDVASAASMPSPAEMRAAQRVAERDADLLSQCTAIPESADLQGDCVSFALRYHRLPRPDEAEKAAEASRAQLRQFRRNVRDMARHEQACEDAGACFTVTVEPR